MKVTKTAINRKLDPAFNFALLRKDKNEEVSFFINTTRLPSTTDIDELKNQGCTRVTPLVGNMLTASAKLGSIPQITALDFVLLLQLGSKIENPLNQP